MERVTVTYARTHLSALAARAEGGETFEITRRGKVVAQLEPIEPQELSRQQSVAAIEDCLA